jgi:hypothetical protein
MSWGRWRSWRRQVVDPRPLQSVGTGMRGQKMGMTRDKKETSQAHMKSQEVMDEHVPI